MSVALLVALALAFDYLLGEPRRYHPLVGFGRLLEALETRFNSARATRADGVLAWCLAVLPLVLLAWLIDAGLQSTPLLHAIWSVGILYLAIGWRSLLTHAEAVIEPLLRGDLDGARHAVAHIVSRDSTALDASGVARGAIESVLENGADAILAAHKRGVRVRIITDDDQTKTRGSDVHDLAKAGIPVSCHGLFMIKVCTA